MLINVRDNEELEHLKRYAEELEHYKKQGIVSEIQYQRDLQYINERIDIIEKQRKIDNGEPLEKQDLKNFTMEAFEDDNNII